MVLKVPVFISLQITQDLLVKFSDNKERAGEILFMRAEITFKCENYSLIFSYSTTPVSVKVASAGSVFVLIFTVLT